MDDKRLESLLGQIEEKLRVLIDLSEDEPSVRYVSVMSSKDFEKFSQERLNWLKQTESHLESAASLCEGIGGEDLTDAQRQTALESINRILEKLSAHAFFHTQIGGALNGHLVGLSMALNSPSLYSRG